MNVKEIITMPDGYKQIQTLPEDPVGTVVYGFATPFSQNIITVFPFPLESAMPFGDALWARIRHSLRLTQGKQPLEGLIYTASSRQHKNLPAYNTLCCSRKKSATKWSA